MNSHSIEQLKKEWTGQSIAIANPSGSLSRFRGRTGTVITINMNGRALVQFEGDADICRYDIPILNLRQVSKSHTAEASPAAPETTPRAAANPSAIPASPAANSNSTQGMSILELARRQGGAK